MSNRVRVSLRFQLTMNELLHEDQVLIVLAACVAIGSIERMLKVGALLADDAAVRWLRSQLPRKFGGDLAGLAAVEAHHAIRTCGFSIGGEGWKQDLANRVSRGPILHDS